MSPRRRLLVRGGVLAVAGLVAAGGLFVVAIVPPTQDSLFPKCHFYQTTGLHCPGCGMTRALHAALNGHFAQALAYNPLAPVLLPIVGLSIVRALWGWAWGETVPRREREPRRWTRWTPWVLFALLAGFWVLRNIPAYPFTLLAPHELAG